MRCVLVHKEKGLLVDFVDGEAFFTRTDPRGKTSVRTFGDEKVVKAVIDLLREDAKRFDVHPLQTSKKVLTPKELRAFGFRTDAELLELSRLTEFIPSGPIN